MKSLKYYLAYLPTWIFYWLGDFISRTMHWHSIFEFLHPVYCVLMGWSVFFNDWGGLDCWAEHTQETEYDDE